MLSYILEVKKDDEFGHEGLVIKAANLYNYTPALEGRLIAHDLLEHSKLNIGGVGNELIALGGIWYVRGQFNNISKFPIYTAEESLAYDVGPDLFIKWQNRNFELPIPQVKTCEAIEYFNTIIENAYTSCLREQQLETITDKKLWVMYKHEAIKYLILGYQLARKRFYFIGGAWAANNLFWEIARVVDTVVERLSLGEQYKLSINMSNCSVYIEEFYPDEPYY